MSRERLVASMLDRLEVATAPARAPKSSTVVEGENVRVFLSGRWTLSSLDAVYEAAEAVTLPKIAGGEASRRDQTSVRRAALGLHIDLSELSGLDTAGAFAIVRLQNRLGGAAVAPFVSAKTEHETLLREIGKAAQQASSAAPAPPPALGSILRLASGALGALRDAWRLTVFLGAVSAALGRVIARPSRFRGTAFVHQLQQTGLNAVPIVALVCFLIGGVVMQQGAQQLRAFGAEAMAVDMLGILTLREVGVLLTAVMVAGRSASAFTAQIGTMKMREEIDAMRTIGIDPVETLILPRVLALIVALPLLVFIANMMALAGGALMAKLYLNLDTPIYLQRLNGAIDGRHFYVGLIKAPFAALIIGLVGCLEGMSVEGSAESVGSQVTTAVVKAIFLVLVLDGVFAIFLSASGF